MRVSLGLHSGWLHSEPLADGGGPVALKLVLLPVGKHVHFEEHVVVENILRVQLGLHPEPLATGDSLAALELVPLFCCELVHVEEPVVIEIILRVQLTFLANVSTLRSMLLL